jgi:hypothetical protein
VSYDGWREAMKRQDWLRRVSVYGTCYVCRAALDTRPRAVIGLGEPVMMLERYCPDCDVVQ